MSSLMMSACENFVENVWSKGKCSNCFKSLTSHRYLTSEERTRKSDKCFDTGANGVTKEQEYTTSNRRFARSNGLALKARDGHVAEGGNKLPTRRKTIPVSTTMKESDPMERKVKPALSPKPKPVPKPRQRTSSALLVCHQSGEVCSRQRSPNAESQRSTEFPGDSEEGSKCINTSDLKTEGDARLEMPSSTKNDRNGESETVVNQSLAILDKEQKTCTESSSGMNDLESVCADSSPIYETQYEEGDDEYVPMKNNVFDITIVENCGTDGLDPDRDIKKRSNSEASITSSDSVFDNAEDDSKEIQNKSSVDVDRNSSVLTSTLHKQVKESHNDAESTKNSDQISRNETKQDCDVSSDACETGAGFPLREKSSNLEVEQANAQRFGDSSWDSRAWESSSDVQENGVKCLEAESVAPRQRSLGELKIKGTMHDPFGSKALRRQSNPDIKAQMPEAPVYVNSNVKPSTKPYKVVDVSTGMLVTDDQSQTPPLPRKAKDLVLDSVPHEYMEPTEGPCKAVPTGGPDNSSRGRVGRPYSTALNPANGQAVTSSLSEPTDLIRHGKLAPRPRSHISAQCGTPKAVPWASRTLREEKSQIEEGTTHTGKEFMSDKCQQYKLTEQWHSHPHKKEVKCNQVSRMVFKCQLN